MKLFLPSIFCAFLFVQCNSSTPDNVTPEPADTTATSSDTASTTPVETTNDNTSDSIIGIDVSHFQGDVPWGAVKADGMQFAYAKCTEGSGFTDPKFGENLSGIRGANLHAGAYHFFMAGDDATEQANLYIKTFGELQSGDMPPMLDLEGGGVKDDESITPEEFQKNVMTWLNLVEAHYGVQPIIYTNHPFADKYLMNNEFSKYKLWIAEYGVTTPKIPTTWEANGSLIWQYSSHGGVEGYSKALDHDYFQGTAAEFEALLAQ